MTGPRTVLGVQIRLIDIVALMLFGGVLLLFLAHVLTMPIVGSPAARCKSRLRSLFRGTQVYLYSYDEFFPPAWHEGSGDGFDQVSYSRFLIHKAVSQYAQLATPATDAEKSEWFERNVAFWADPVTGLTNDYFSPPRVLKLPRSEEMREPFARHTQYTELTAAVPSTQMPFLTETTASIPRPDADDDDQETRSGIRGGYKSRAFRLDGEVYDALYGVARSWSEWTEPWLPEESGKGSGHQRFDFRHNGAINVVFLDGHVDSIKKNRTEHLEKLHQAWNSNSTGAP